MHLLDKAGVFSAVLVTVRLKTQRADRLCFIADCDRRDFLEVVLIQPLKVWRDDGLSLATKRGGKEGLNFPGGA